MEGRIRLTRVVIAGSVVVAVASGGALAAQTLARRPAQPAPSILAPRNGQRLPARPVAIKIYMGSAQLAGAGLNGRGIGNQLQFGRFHDPCGRVKVTRGAVCQLQASPSHGLRYGVNVLRVRFKQGRSIRVRTVRFRLANNRPVAAAGVDQYFVPPDTRIRLNGGASLMPPGLRTRLVRAGKRPRLRYRWQVVQAPRPILAGGDDRPGKRDPYWSVPAEIAGAGTAAPSVELDSPGTYKLRLTVTAPDGRTGTDLLTLVPGEGGVGDQSKLVAPPAVTIDTMATQGDQPGIRVGNDFYAAPARKMLQILILDRQTLDPARSQNLGTSCLPVEPHGSPLCDEDVWHALAMAGNNALVVVSLQRDYLTHNPPCWIADSLVFERIGVVPADCPRAQYRSTNLMPKTFSALGVVDGSSGQSVVHYDNDNSVGGGRITGYLLRSSHGDYTYISGDQGVPVDTQADGSSASTNAVQVGAGSYEQDLGSLTKGGFQVVVIDRKTLKLVSSDLIDTSVAASSRKLLPALQRLRDTLAAANDNGERLVVVASRGLPAVNVDVTAKSSVDDLRQAGLVDLTIQQVADQIEQLGGTRNAIFAALDPALSKQTSYSLLGGSHLGAGFGQESFQAGTSLQRFGMNAAPLVGTLARTGHDYDYQPREIGAAGESVSGGGHLVGVTQLMQVALQPQSQWPETDPAAGGSPGRVAALASIAKAVKNMSTQEFRNHYWIDIYDAGEWDKTSAAVTALPTPAASPDFSTAGPGNDFDWAKNELVKEIGWLQSTHSYLNKLSLAYGQLQLNAWAQLDKISQDIRAKFVSTDLRAFVRAKEFIKLVRGIAGALPKVGEGAKIANEIYAFAMDGAETSDGKPAGDDFDAAAKDVGVDLAQRLFETQKTLNEQMPNVIAADYQKLKTVGACASSLTAVQADCPAAYTPSDWKYEQADLNAAENTLPDQLNVGFYKALLPARYTLYRLPDWWRTKVNGYPGAGTSGHNSDFYGNFNGPCSICFPFENEPDTGQFAKPILRLIPVYFHSVAQDPKNRYASVSTGDTWEIFALGHKDGGGTNPNDPWTMQVPAASVTDDLFKPTGKYHVYPEQFFDQAFSGDSAPQTLNQWPFKNVYSPAGWCWRYYRDIDYNKACNS